MPKIGDLGSNIAVLREMRSQLIESTKRIEREEERWGSLGKTASKISVACEDRDLEQLVSSARELKNRLRRPSIKKDLARLEMEAREARETQGKPEEPPAVQPKKKEEPKGDCKCAECGKVIEGSKGECEEGSLCVDCAFKKKPEKNSEKDKPGKKKPKFDDDDTEKDGSEETKKEESFRAKVKYLRQRGYTR